MKRITALLLILVMLTGLLTACGECDHTYDNATDYLCNDCNHNRLAGTWTTTIEGQPGEMTLNTDGTGQVTSHGEIRPCTWEIHQDTLTVVQDVEGFVYTFLDKVSFTLENTTLTVTSQSDNTLVFEKK